MTVAGLALVAASGGCARAPVEIPEPDLDQAGFEVAEAVRNAQQAVRRSPRSAEAWAGLGDRYRAHRWWSEAAASYARAEELEPSNFLWPYLLGDCLRYDHPEEAEQAFRRALALDATYVPPRLFLGRVLSRLGKDAEADEMYRSALRLDPRSEHALLGLGRVAISQGHFDDAIDLLRRALDLNEEFAEAHLALSQALLAKGAVGLGEVHAKRAKSLPMDTPIIDERGVRAVEPAGALAHHNRGHDFEDAGDLEQALEAYRRSANNDPEFAEAYFDMGRLHARRGEVAMAEEVLRRGLELKPSHVESQVTLGTILYGQGRWEEAEGPLRAAVKLAPERPLADAGHDREAIEAYRQALKVSPGVTPAAQEAARGLAWVLATASDPGLRDPAEAVTWAERVAEAGPPDARTKDVLGVAYAAAGRYEEAASVAEEALGLAEVSGPQDLRAAIGQRLALYRQGRPFHR
jgi:tetratricopeptide (TPR) repeat protein